ncbi:MAG: helix-turn-helix domain-containing protein [Thalassovita sp.]
MTASGKHMLPGWVPQAAHHYLAHTEDGLSMRLLARQAGCHASTVMRQIRKLECRRDDQLVDQALRRLELEYIKRPSVGSVSLSHDNQEDPQMTAHTSGFSLPDEDRVNADSLRILRRLSEAGAVLAVAPDMEKAVVLRETANGNSLRTAVVDRTVAEAMALKHWIDCASPGRISRYHITTEGRAALTQLIARAESELQPGFAEAQTPFTAAPFRAVQSAATDEGQSRRVRYSAAESPLALLARRRDKNGRPFLSEDLVTAGERLREDFELCQLGGQDPQDWQVFLSQDAATAQGQTYGATQARDRVSGALRDLGPGLGDVVLRCCCYLEGLEAAEKRMGWSARSGKIVLRIALQRLRRHYDGLGADGAMIG